MDIRCAFFEALRFRDEGPGIWCAGRKVSLPKLHAPPKPLTNIFQTGTTNELNYSLADICWLNSVSRDMVWCHTYYRRRIVPNVHSAGKCYYRTSSLLSLANSDCGFLQIYLIDSMDAQVIGRCRLNEDTRRSVGVI